MDWCNVTVIVLCMLGWMFSVCKSVIHTRSTTLCIEMDRPEQTVDPDKMPQNAANHDQGLLFATHPAVFYIFQHYLSAIKTMKGW